jgi:Mn2+/Fe2+ NRAMP family transporter
MAAARSPARRDVMGAQVNHRVTTIFAWSCAIMVVAMNIFLLCQQFFLS